VNAAPGQQRSHIVSLALVGASAQVAAQLIGRPPSDDRFRCVPNLPLWRWVASAPGQVLACLAHRGRPPGWRRRGCGQPPRTARTGFARTADAGQGTSASAQGGIWRIAFYNVWRRHMFWREHA